MIEFVVNDAQFAEATENNSHLLASRILESIFTIAANKERFLISVFRRIRADQHKIPVHNAAWVTRDRNLFD